MLGDDALQAEPAGVSEKIIRVCLEIFRDLDRVSLPV
jgi:hypothetical protein